MKKYLFFILFLISSNNLIVSYPLSFGGGFSYQFTNYTDKTGATKFAPNFTRADHGINLNLFFDANYVLFEMSYKEAFVVTHNGRYFSLGLYGTYPMVFKEQVRMLFPLIGFKYAFDLSSNNSNLFFLSMGLAADLFIPDLDGLYIRPLFMLSISPFSNYKNFSGLTTEIMLGFNIGWRFFN
ncbi:hypothetical protein LRB60_05130 [Borreliella burgdorferi]|uniref:hypothetical protein n=1 Tax=Borreliella burgdorferi TaxID=139 RepID=UPI00017F48ED|nr:hypothetical protein [Borreliella burgdorferi]ADQ30591.1 conserved hypothetical protein [Borreliella burgdorferi JD1]EEF56342.1 conserved hypothetical protein [Borreliella burgdorferi 64b]MCD2321946.1 hypothetical protein [Borreliella burgdorferi]MCD2410028.1 hypothetical protein [Borreliella burgdorferi]MCD2412176.1 hypothetical protein [Borreliella burgdorferi]